MYLAVTLLGFWLFRSVSNRRSRSKPKAPIPTFA
jgi:hypothetical protein